MSDHPFDERVSGKNPFPCFDATMRCGASVAARGARTDGIDSNDSWESESDCSNGSGCKCDSAESVGDCECECETTSQPPTSLNWSIDGLATLLPVAFSPLPQQKLLRQPTTSSQRRRQRWSSSTGSTGSSSDTTETTLLLTPPWARSATFFDDEEQYRVLRTPLAVIHAEQMWMQQQAAATVATVATEQPTLFAGASPWRDLHRRCVETMQFCESRVRERQHKLAKLPVPASKLKLKRRVAPTSSCIDGYPLKMLKMRAIAPPSSAVFSSVHSFPAPAPSRDPSSTPVAVATRLSFGAIDLSPIPVDSAEKNRFQTMEGPTTPTSTARTEDDDSALFSSPPLSSISEHRLSETLTPSFASLMFSPSSPDDDDDNGEEEAKENKENQHQTPSSGGSLRASSTSSSSLKPMSLLRGGGNTSQSAASSSSYSSSPPSSCSPFVTPPPIERVSQKSDTDTEAIAQRQLSFVAAIEEEAQARDAAASNTPTQGQPKPREMGSATTESDNADAEEKASSQRIPRRTAPGDPIPPPRRLVLPPPATSMASLYREARALGITEPTAQFEYVQLISRQTTTTTTTTRTRS